MRTILLFIILCSFSVQAQSYSLSKISTIVNGDPGEMKGVPGDLFAATLTFSNSSASVINVFIDRYKNNIPAYWGVCYCYIQCHNTHQDTITIEIQPFSTTNITLQFKTDSVNPGIAYDSFKIYQIGFQNSSQNLDLTATTMNDVGIRETKYSNSTLRLYPNPSINELNISIDEEITGLKIYNAFGKLMVESKNINSVEYKLKTGNYECGIYFIEVYSEKNKYVRNFIKN